MSELFSGRAMACNGNGNGTNGAMGEMAFFNDINKLKRDKFQVRKRETDADCDEDTG